MHLSGDVVLLITHSGDFFTIDRVAEALLRKGAQPEAKVDWHKPGVEVGAWQHHQLPNEFMRRLQTFMGKFGLSFGSLDFILTPSGEYVFLEINPLGEWGMLEKDLDLPIASAIAEVLLTNRN